MPTSHELLSAVIERSGLNPRDRHWLYSYKVSPAELEQIRSELQNRVLLAGRMRIHTEYAAFCLFAAEWFRLHHQSGPWQWKTILDGVGIDRDTWSQTDASEHAINGLAWWGLDVIHTGSSRRFLTSVVSQGGFPVNTLRAEGAKIKRVLRSGLHEHERFPDEPLARFVEAVGAGLPDTLRTPGFLQLLAKTIEALACVRRDSSGAKQEGITRKDWLDRHLPNWHQSLPFRLEDEDAQSLLLSLLESPEPVLASERSLSVVTSLATGRAGDGFLVARSLDFPTRIDRERFQPMFGQPFSLRPRMVGYLRVGGQEIPACRISQSAVETEEAPQLRLSPVASGGSVTGREGGEARFAVRCGAEELGVVILSGGDRLPDSPWVFRAQTPHELIGVGSVTTREPELWVAVPENARLSAEGSEEQPCKINGRRLFAIRGDARIEDEDAIYNLRTSRINETATLYELRGRHWSSGTGGSVAWLGTPAIVETMAGESRLERTLSRKELSWKPSDGGDWRSIDQSCLGDVILRARVADETTLLSRATVLPEGFRLRTSPDRRPCCGRWTFHGLGACDFAIGETAGVEAQHKVIGEDLVVDLVIGPNRPDLIDARLRFPNGCVARLRLVTPTKSCLLVNSAGVSTDSNKGIALEQLGGLWLRVTSPNSANVYLVDSDNIQIGVFDEVSPGVWEYPLSRARTRATGLLAETDDREARPRLAVSIGTPHDRSFEVRVGRYGYRLGPPEPTEEPGHCIVSLQSDDMIDSLRMDPADVRVIGLNDPDNEISDCVVAETPGSWRVDLSGAEPGYYLFTGRTASGDLLRPLRLSAGNLPKPPAGKTQLQYSFDEISTISSEAERRTAWEAFYARLGADFGAPDWAKVDAVVEASIDLPITTFEAVTALVRNPLAAARAGIRFADDARIWRRLEELPFLWALVPVEIWVRAAARWVAAIRSPLADAGLPSEQVLDLSRRVIAVFGKAAGQHHAYAHAISGCFFAARLIEQPPSNWVRPWSDDEDQQELSALIARHDRFDSRQTWPSDCPRYSREVKTHLDRTVGLLIEPRFANERAVVHAPAIAAVHAVYGLPVGGSELRKYQRLHTFDADWFDAFFLRSVIRLVYQRNAEEPRWLETVVDENLY